MDFVKELEAAALSATERAYAGDVEAAIWLIEYLGFAMGCDVIDDNTKASMAAAIHELRPLAGYSLQ